MISARTISDAFAKTPAPVRGAFWMILAGTILSAMNVLVRYLADDMHPLQLVFFRNLGQLLFMLPWLMKFGLGGLRTTRIKLYTLRGLVGIVAMISFFMAITMMPIAKATAISFSAPIFATLGAVLILGETVRARRWTATIIGFIGTLIILRPGFMEIDLAIIFAVVAAVFLALSSLIIKALSSTETPDQITFYMALFLTPLALVPALFVWQWPDLAMLPWLLALGALATAGHRSLNRAFASADVSAVLPYDFLRLPVTALIAYIAFGEGVDAWTWAGAVVIFSSTIYIARRETKLARKTASAPAVEAVGEDKRGGR